MDSAVAVFEAHESVEAVYRADAERLWRAIYAFAGDAEIASDAVAEAFAQVLHRGADDEQPSSPEDSRVRRTGCSRRLSCLTTIEDHRRVLAVLAYLRDAPSLSPTGG